MTNEEQGFSRVPVLAKNTVKDGVDTSINLSGLNLLNPIIPASGCFGYGREFANLYDIRILGSFSCKGTTVAERFGNPTPRIAETASGMLNAVGLQNPGVAAVLREEIPNIEKIFGKPIVANISGFSISEYCRCAELLSQEKIVGILEINISCPNVKGGGISFGQDPALAYEVTKAVKAHSSKPVYVKLSPNVTDIAAIAVACEEAGADGISLINTLVGMRLDIRRRQPILRNRTGGLSGPSVFPIALRMVWDCYEKVQIPIIGMGGIQTAEDVVEMMMAGARAVEIGAANLVDPYICKKIIADLPQVMEELGVRNLVDIVGAAHKR